jgi:spore germination cell wall hydrolase CwlJ-like protein
MLHTLLHELRIWPVLWRRRFAVYRLGRAREHLTLIAILAVPALVLGTLVYFALTDEKQMSIQAQVARMDAANRRAVELNCLAENVYFEARGEPLAGQYAIAEVTLNRLRSPNFPDTICDVVHETRWDRLRRRLVAHFSWTQEPAKAEPTGHAWDQAMVVATAVYDHQHDPVVPGALFYHATSVQPYWVQGKRVVARIGHHIFYR